MNMTDEILNSWTDADEVLADKIEKLESFFNYSESDRVNTTWDSFPTNGGFLYNFRFSVNGNVFVGNISAIRSGFMNQYFTAVARYGGKNHTVTGYISFTLTDRQVIGSIINAELDGTSIDAPVITRLGIMYVV